ncbi:MAG: hypothetical protein E7676_00270 [Ruminococcaceae bacterium]|nr:hypothetical protein [Oscillospiraceae bacterium]
MGFFGRWRERIARFMIGRYGIDSLYHFLVVLCFVLIVVNLFVGSLVISILETALLIYAAFRVLSRNIYKRQRENMFFLKITEKPREFFKLLKCKFRDRKTHVYKKCPSCKNNLRLPKKKGKHTVSCPCCQNRFDIKI